MIPLAQLAVAAGVTLASAAGPVPAAADTVQPVAAPPADRWFGPDKVKHFLVAGLAEGAAYAAARTAGADRKPALVGATVVAVGVSVGKELHDRKTGRGQPSVRDLVWDLAGIAAYGALLARTPQQ